MNQISPALVEDTEQLDRGLWPGEPPSFGVNNLDDLLIWAYREGASDIRLQTNTPDSGKPVCVTDLTTGEIQPVSPELAASPARLLPLFLAAGDTVWRDTTGRRLCIKQVDDPQSLLGVRTQSIGAGPVTPVLLSVMEAMAQAERPDMLLVNDMSRNWATANDRMRRLRLHPVEAASPTSPTPSAGGMQP